MIGVFLSGGLDGEYDNEPNRPQLLKATNNACDVIEGSLGISIRRKVILEGALVRYKLSLPLSTSGQGGNGSVSTQYLNGEQLIN